MIAKVWGAEKEPYTSFCVTAQNQTWDKDTIKQLKDEYHIFFNGTGVRPVMLIPYRNNAGCCVVIGYEDDGAISFTRNECGSFDDVMSLYWVDDLIQDLTDAKEYVENGGKV